MFQSLPVACNEKNEINKSLSIFRIFSNRNWCRLPAALSLRLFAKERGGRYQGGQEKTRKS